MICHRDSIPNHWPFFFLSVDSFSFTFNHRKHHDRFIKVNVADKFEIGLTTSCPIDDSLVNNLDKRNREKGEGRLLTESLSLVDSFTWDYIIQLDEHISLVLCLCVRSNHLIIYLTILPCAHRRKSKTSNHLLLLFLHSRNEALWFSLYS